MTLKLTPPVIAGCVAACGLVGAGFGFWSSTPERVVFLSVGQGDCTLVQSEGRTLLIDVGPDDEKARTPLSEHLRSLGVSRVDEVLLSHPDADHIGGLPDVMRLFPQAEVQAPECFEHDDKMTRAMDKAGVPLSQRRWTNGEVGSLGAFKLEVRCHPWSAGEDDNFGSMFVKVSDGAATLVTTGDGPAEEEWDELSQLDWHAEIIHFGHHGSKTASSVEWLQAVHPVYGIVSCGKNNPYGHPHRQTLERAQAAGIEVHRTDREGDIEFSVIGGRFALGR